MREDSINIEQFTVDDDGIWFTDLSSNGVFYISKKKMEVELYCEIENESSVGKWLFGGIIKYKGKMIIYPRLAKSFYRIETDSKSVKQIHMIEKVENNKYLAAVLIEGVAYIVGGSQNNMIVYDFSKDKIISKKDNIFDDSDMLIPVYCRNVARVSATELGVPLCKENGIGIYNYVNDLWSVKFVGDENNKYSGLCINKETVWLSPLVGNNLIGWNIENEGVESIQIDYKINGEYTSSGCIYYNGYIWVFPLSSIGVWRLNCETKNGEFFSKISRSIGRICAYGANEYLYFFSNETGILYKVDYYDNVFEYKLKMPDEILKKKQLHLYKKIEERLKEKCILKEQKNVSVREYIKYINNKWGG